MDIPIPHGRFPLVSEAVVGVVATIMAVTAVAVGSAADHTVAALMAAATIEKTRNPTISLNKSRNGALTRSEAGDEDGFFVRMRLFVRSTGMRLAWSGFMQTTTNTTIEQFVDFYYLPVFRFAARICDDPARALMLTDCTFRDALERSRNLPIPANVREWLCSILFCKFLESRPRGYSA